jgi:NAD(P)-dependent dehydrogenase (short-subunit alcohol dehydrogenase family)
MSDSMPEEVIKAGIAMIPVKRIGTPEDMGHAYLFLAFQRGWLCKWSYVTCQWRVYAIIKNYLSS